MKKMRVFELARELNIPSKQMIQELNAIGVITESNFNILTEEQVALVRANILGDDVASNKKVRKSKVLRRSENKTDAHDDPDTVEKRPRRIRKLRKAVEEQVVEPVAEKDPSADPVIKEAVEPEKPAIEVQETPTVAEKEPGAEVTEQTSAAEPEPEATQEELKPKPSDQKKEALSITDGGKKQKTVIPVVEKQPPSSSREDKSDQPKQVPEKKAVEFQSFETTASKEKKKDKKQPRSEEQEQEELRSKKASKRFAKVSEEDDGAMWERSRRKRLRRTKQKSKPQEKKHTFNPRKKSIKVGSQITIGELAGVIGIKAPDIIRKLMGMGTMATINQSISGENAELVAAEFDIEVELDTKKLEDALEESDDSKVEKVSRAPIVTIMGHVDHGKTSLLDKIRATRVTEGEAGGITQHIGAYRVKTKMGDIAFLDTPGHEAFTAMRARGANVTDIVVLVVAANDGVRPQTIEAIHHSQAAGVPIVVAINKVDLPDANASRVQQELLEHGLVSEDFGGDTIFVQVSAKTGDGIDTLLEMLHLQAEVLELEAPATGRARGIIIESQINKGRGPVGTVLIQQGRLQVGDYYVVGETFGKVRALFNDRGQAIERALPSTPAEVLGFNSVPDTGEEFIVLEDEKTARQIAANRAHKSKDDVASQQQKMHLENLFSRINSEEQVKLSILIKADVHGSAEALQSALSQLGNENVSVNCIHTATGSITEHDVLLAAASDAIIIGFNTSLDAKAKTVNNREGVDIRLYNVIYDAIEDVTKALEGLLKPTLRDEVIGRCEVREIFNMSKAGQILGCYVTEGKLLRDAMIRVFRQEDVIHEGDLISLKRFKDDVREVLNNYECGVIINYEDIEVGDMIEAYIQVEESVKL
ncbi:MAG: translation initiation factor IF-2 [SAR324 cluster bacterium]|nr:translation initiation factor IF-2 [SAR324 cluster bacterium]